MLKYWTNYSRNVMKAGFSTVDITPPLGSESPGGFGKKFLWDVHDPLRVKTAVLENDGVRVALVGVDALSIMASTVRAGREMTEKITGIPSDHIMVAASHTHRGGPVLDWAGTPDDYASSSRYEFIKKLLETASSAEKDYLSFLSRQIASSVVSADKHKVEAKCAVGVGEESSVSFNRRFKMRNGRQMTHPGKGNPDILEPAGPVDPAVGVLSAWGVDGNFLGCVVNFACHGTTMSSHALSADWPYYLDRTIRGVMEEDSTVVFLNGPCGDVTQVDNRSIREPEFGEKWARIVGQKVGAEALKVIAEAEPGDFRPLKAAQTILQIERRKVPPERLERAYALVKSNAEVDLNWYLARDAILLSERYKIEKTIPCEIQAVQVGPAIFVSNPAELFCQLGLDIKSASPFPYTFVVELANGSFFYVPTEEAMGPSGGGYETRMGMHSKLVPSAGNQIVEASIDLIKKFTPGKSPEIAKVEKSEPWDIGTAGPDEI
jgi:hypothetical protein